MKAPLNKALDALLNSEAKICPYDMSFEEIRDAHKAHKEAHAELKAYIEGAKDITDQPIFIDRVTRSHDYLLKGIKNLN